MPDGSFRRNTRLLIAYRATSRSVLFAPYLYHFVIGVRGLSIAEFGVLQALYYFVAVSLEVPSGVLADRWGRKRTLVAGGLLAAVGSFLRVFAFDFWSFAAAELCFASALALVSGADSALLYDSLASEGREDDYPRAEAWAQSSWLAATALGMPLTDFFLVRAEDPVLAFVATGCLALVSVACALAMREPPMLHRQSAREITLGAFRDVVGIPGLLRLLIYSAGVFVLLRAAITLFFNPALARVGIPVDRFGTALAVVNLAGALAAGGSHRLIERLGERRAFLLMPASMMLMYVLLTRLETPWVAALFCIQGIVLGIYPVAVRTALNRLVASPSRRATTLSFDSMICRLAYGIGVLGIAGSMDAIGFDAAVLVTVVLAAVFFAAMRRLPRESGA